ncbi:MAG: hypothetical protein ACK4P3_02825 [Fimbriimonadaceae bacterium]
MTTVQVVTELLEDSRIQLEKSIEGLPSELEDVRVSENTMSPKEAVVHLSEVYLAFQGLVQGKKYEWGSFLPRSERFSECFAEALELRNELVAMILAASQFKIGIDVALHDQYHVGQICMVRQSKDPTWDWRALYRHYTYDL